MIRSGGKNVENYDKSIDADDFEDDGDGEVSEFYDNDWEDPEKKFHYIITEQNEYGDEIPKVTKLKEVLSHERIQFNIKDHFLQLLGSTKSIEIMNHTNSSYQS